MMVRDKKVSINILPFGHLKIMFGSGSKKLKENKKPVYPIYTEPRSTSIEKVEILYEGVEEYIVPKTTGEA